MFIRKVFAFSSLMLFTTLCLWPLCVTANERGFIDYYPSTPIYTLYYENFENDTATADATEGNWFYTNKSTGGGQVSAVTPWNGSQCYVGSHGNGVARSYINLTGFQIKWTIGFTFKMTGTSSNFGRFLTNASPGVSSKYIGFYNNASVSYNDGTTNTFFLTSGAKNRWYHLQMRRITATTATFAIWDAVLGTLNGTKNLGLGLNWDNDLNVLGTFESAVNTMAVYYDDFFVDGYNYNEEEDFVYLRFRDVASGDLLQYMGQTGGGIGYNYDNFGAYLSVNTYAMTYVEDSLISGGYYMFTVSGLGAGADTLRVYAVGGNNPFGYVDFQKVYWKQNYSMDLEYHGMYTVNLVYTTEIESENLTSEGLLEYYEGLYGENIFFEFYGREYDNFYEVGDNPFIVYNLTTTLLETGEHELLYKIKSGGAVVHTDTIAVLENCSGIFCVDNLFLALGEYIVELWSYNSTTTLPVTKLYTSYPLEVSIEQLVEPDDEGENLLVMMGSIFSVGMGIGLAWLTGQAVLFPVGTAVGAFIFSQPSLGDYQMLPTEVGTGIIVLAVIIGVVVFLVGR